MITLSILLLIFLIAYVFYTEQANITIALHKGILFGFSQSSNYFEEEGETDHYFQVALFLIIINLTWTTKDES